MKKFLPLLMFCALLMTGCDGSDSTTIKIGTIPYLNVTEDALNNFMQGQPESGHMHLKHEYIFYDNMPSMTSALLAGQIDELSTYETVADYLINQNQRLERAPDDNGMIDMFCCALREDEVELKTEFDTAIRAMRQDGTFTRLLKDYMSSINHSVIPEPIEMPTFYDAQTIRIGVTGDLPRMDYIRADGVPAGFNTAVLAEISRRIGKNFLLVQIDSGVRAAALFSGTVDVVFWAAVADKANGIPTDFDRPAGMIFTEPYFSDRIVHVHLKK